MSPPPPLRLCFIGPHTHIHMVRWVRFFIEKGHTVSLISTDAKEPTVFMGCPVFPFPVARAGNYHLSLFWGFFTLPFQVLRLRRLLRKLTPDIVHVHYINEVAFYTLLTGYHPLMLTAWGSDILISPDRSKVRRWAVRRIVSRADALTCDADHMKNSIVLLGAPPEKVSIVFFGTDVERCHPKNKDDAFRLQWAPSSSSVVVSIRNLEPIYDIDSLIKAAAVVIKKSPNTVFWIGGKGSERLRLGELADSLGISSQVKFLGPFSSEDLPKILASSDVYVSTALSDGGLAASTAEAMACGVPVIVTDVGNNRQWVEEGRDGLVVPPRDAESLSDALLKLLSSPDARRRMGESGRAVIVERNNSQKEMSRVENLYRNIIASTLGKETAP